MVVVKVAKGFHYVINKYVTLKFRKNIGTLLNGNKLLINEPCIINLIN